MCGYKVQCGSSSLCHKGHSQGVVGLNLVLSDTVFSLLILVAWGMVNQNQDDAR